MRTAAALPLALLALVPLRSAAAQATDSAARAVASALPLRPASELRTAGRRYAPAVRTCYEREGLVQDPSLRGRLEVAFTVAPDGRVSRIAVDTLDVRGVGMREVARCVGDAAAAWHLSEGAFAAEEVVLAYDLVPPESRRADGAPALPPADSLPPSASRPPADSLPPAPTPPAPTPPAPTR